MSGNATERFVTTLGEIPPGEGRAFEIDGKRLAIFHTRAGEVFATDAMCPHKGGPMADGLLGDGTVLCPLHAWKFDLRTGDAITGLCSINIYPARLDDKNHILLRI